MNSSEGSIAYILEIRNGTCLAYTARNGQKQELQPGLMTGQSSYFSMQLLMWISLLLLCNGDVILMGKAFV